MKIDESAAAALSECGIRYNLQLDAYKHKHESRNVGTSSKKRQIPAARLQQRSVLNSADTQRGHKSQPVEWSLVKHKQEVIDNSRESTEQTLWIFS